MAFITSDGLFLQSIFSFGPMFRDSVATSFFNNAPFGYETTTPWNDAIETAYTAGRGTPFTTAFTGDALGITPRNIETGTLSGRVEGIFTYTGHRATGDLVHAASIWGFSVRLADIQSVALTTSNADDQALLQTILSGNDVIRLGRFGDKVAGFGGDDRIFAGAGSDEVQGGVGADLLFGQNGFDTLIGGDGADTIVGGKHADEMRGGAGRDVFIFDDGHVGLGQGARDLILDWNPYEDVLDFSRMDANNTLAGDQGFRAIVGSGISLTTSNSVTILRSGEDMMIRIEVTGDNVHDFEIRLVGAARYDAALFDDFDAAVFQRLFIL